MADQRYVIDIILKAQDRTADAMASVAAKLGLQKEALKEAEAANTKYAASWDRANRQINTSQNSLIENQKRLGAANQDTIDSQVKLIKATRDYHAATRDGKQSTAEFVQVQGRMIAAQKELEEAIKESNTYRQKEGEIDARVFAEELKSHTVRMENAKERMQIARELAQIEMETQRDISRAHDEALTEEKRRHSEMVGLIDDLDKAHQKSIDAQLDREDRAEQERRARLERNATAEQNALNDIRRATEDLENYRQEVDDRESDREAKRLAREHQLAVLHQEAIDLDRQRGEQEQRHQERTIAGYQQQIQAVTRLEEQKRRVDEQARQAPAGDDIHALKERVDVDTAEAQAHLIAFVEEAKQFGIHLNVDLDTAAARAELRLLKHEVNEVSTSGGGILGGLKGAFGTLAGEVEGSSTKIAAFDNLIRGALTFLIAGFLQPLIVLAGAAGGALLALGSSAIYAGGALVGGLAAGIMQAIPVIGILIAFVSRLKAVFDAAKQSQLLEQQQSYKGAQQNKKLADTAGQLAAAHDQVAAAQRALTQARKQAADQLEQLINKEREAALAARGAVLSQRDAQEALQAAIRTGGNVEAAQLNVDEANARVDETRQTVQVAHRERRTAMAQGIEGAPGVVAAKQQIENAQRAVDRAARGADIASANISAAAGKLDFLLGRMSAAERRLYETVKTLQDVFRVQSGKIVEPLIDATDHAMKRMITLLSDNRIVGQLRSLASTMASEMTRFFNSFTNPKAIHQLMGFIEEAKKNLHPLTSVLINIGHTFENIGQAAGPALSEILKWLRGITQHWEKWTGSKEGQKSLTDFFMQGAKHLESWLHLLGSVVKLFLAIAGIGAGTGKGFVDDTAKGIDRLTDSINKGGKGAKFFKDLFATTKEVIKAIGPVATAIGSEFQKTFGGHGVNAVKGFATFLADVLIPAFGRFVRGIGALTSELGKFGRTHPLITKLTAAFLAFGLSFGFMGKAFAFLGPVLKLIRGFGIVSGIFEKNEQALFGVSRAAGGLRVALGFLVGPAGLLIALGAIVVYLLARFHLLDDVWRGVVKAFKSVGNELAAPFHELEKALGIGHGNIKSFGDALDKYLKPFFTVVVRHIMIPAIQLLIHFLAGPLVGAFTVLAKAVHAISDIVRGFIKIFDGLIHLRFGEVIDGFVQLGKGLLEGLLAPFAGLWAMFKNIFNGLIQSIKSLFGISSPSKVFADIGQSLVDGLVGAFTGIGKFILSKISAGIHAIASGLSKLGGWIFDKFWGFLKAEFRGLTRIGSFIVNTIGDGIRAVGSGLRKVAGWLFDKFWSFIKTEWRGLKNIGHFIMNAISDSIHGIGNGLKSVGSKIVDFLVEGIRGAVHKVEEIFKGIKPRFDISVNPVHPHAHMWLGDTKLFALGGPVPGQGDGDTVPALLTPGEHVLTKNEVQAAGGHPAIFALRRLLGGGGQGGGGRFAEGGVVNATGIAAANTSVSVSFADAKKLGNQFVAFWLSLWNRIGNLTDRGTTDVQRQFRQMRLAVTSTIEALTDRAKKEFDQMESSMKTSAKTMTKSVTESLDSLQTAAYRALRYVSREAGDALHGFGGDVPKVSITAPPSLAGKAGGGWIGSPGERGRDAIPTVLGRGEAVLNWAHQKVVNSALWNQYGTTLDGLFKNTNAYHAGGPGQAIGFARGGLTGPFGSASAFNVVANFAKKKFGLSMTAGRTNHNYLTASGNVSDHSSGMAGDFAIPGVQTPEPKKDAFNAFWKTKLPQTVKQLIYRNKDQFNGYPIPDHMNHVHLALLQQYAFNDSKMAQLISRASRGLDITDLLSGDPNSTVEHVKKILMKSGPLAKLGQSALGKVVGAINAFIDKQAEKMGVGADSGQTEEIISNYKGPLNKVFPKHFTGQGGVRLSPEQVARIAASVGLPGTTFAQIAHGESDYYPGVQQRDPGDGNVGYGLWQMTPHAWGAGSAAYNYMQKLGGIAAMFNPIKNAMMAKFLYDAAGHSIAPWYGTKYVTGHAKGGFGGFFADGGTVPGQSGQPVPIVAHAGEWVLNKMQQSRMASALGTSIDKLRSILGFTGGPTHFAGGGEITHTAPFENFGPKAAEEYRYQQRLATLQHMRARAQDEDDKKRVAHLNAIIKLEDKRHDTIDKGLKKAESAFQKIIDSFEHATTDTQRRRIGMRQGIYVAPDVTRVSAAGDSDVSGVQQQLRFAFNAIRRIGSRHLSQPIQRLLANLNALGGDNGLFAQLDTAIDTRATRMETDRSLLAVGLRHVRKFVRGKGGIRRLVDHLTKTNIADPNVLLEQEQTQLGETISDRIKERGRIVAALNSTQARMRNAKKGTAEYAQLVGKYNEFVKDLDAIDGKIATDKAKQLENARTLFNNSVDTALKPAQDKGKWADFYASIGKTLGNDDLVKAANSANLESLQSQQKTLGAKYQEAVEKAKTDPAFQAIADKLGDDWRTVTKSIVDAQAQALTDQMAAIETAASRSLKGLDVTDHGADIQEKLGDVTGAISTRQGTNQQRINVLSQERSRFQELQQQALAQGNMAVYNDLADKITDLTTNIDDLNLNTRALVAEYRKASIEAITKRVEGQTDWISTAQNIVQKIGEATGVTDNSALAGYLQNLGELLKKGATDIAEQINKALNNNEFTGAAKDAISGLSAAFAAGPKAFADQLNSLAPIWDRIMAGLTPEEQDAFNALVKAMSDNTMSTLDNTKSLDDLKGGLSPQSWATSSWSWFRSAIFNGMGDILPQYQVPQLATGGIITKRGIFELHPGEHVVPEKHVTQGGDTNVYITEPMEVADPLYLAKRIEWERSNGN